MVCNLTNKLTTVVVDARWGVTAVENTFEGTQLRMSCLQLTASWLQRYVRKGLCDGVANRRGFPKMGLPNLRGLDLT